MYFHSIITWIVNVYRFSLTLFYMMNCDVLM